MRSPPFRLVAALVAVVTLCGVPFVTGPPIGAIAADVVTVELDAHRFGQTRTPAAMPVSARPGDGPNAVGVVCPTEGGCSMPTSFDVAADGTVWVTDPVHQRLLAWAPGRSDRVARSIPTPFVPADLALASDGAIYVTGLRPGVDRTMQLFAFAADGSLRWRSPLPADAFTYNAHIRLGPGGLLFGAFRSGDTAMWTAAVGPDGRPINAAEQLRLAEPGRPVAGGGRLEVTGSTAPGHVAPTTWDVVLRDAAGARTRAWRLVSPDDLGLSLEAEPAMLDGEPVLVFDVYRYEDHVMEHLVVRLATTGLADRLSLPRGGARRALTVTDVRIGGDGRLYQLSTDAETGVTVARYDLAAGSSPSPSPAPTIASPTPVPSRSATASPSVSPAMTGSPTPTVPTGSPVASATAAASATPTSLPSDGASSAAPVAIVVGALVALAAITAVVALGARRSASRKP